MRADQEPAIVIVTVRIDAAGNSVADIVVRGGEPLHWLNAEAGVRLLTAGLRDIARSIAANPSTKPHST